MKKLLLIVPLFWWGCSPPPATDVPANDSVDTVNDTLIQAEDTSAQLRDYFEQLTVLEGNWCSDGFCEHWQRYNDTLYTGKGYGLQGNDTTFSETLAIALRADGIFYLATVPDQNEARTIPFKLQWHHQHDISFTNPLHDFPQSIHYQITGDTAVHIHVTGREKGNDRAIDFYLNKQ